jgi:Xaa-Pro dipeptidase
MKPLFHNRQDRLFKAMNSSGFDAVILNPGSSLLYLTGVPFHLMERPVVVLFKADSPVVFILPELESPKMENLSFAAGSFFFGEDKHTWPAIFAQALQSAGLEHARVGVEAEHMRVLELRYLEAALPAADFVPIEESLMGLRATKDADELAAMKKAVEIAQDALQATLPLLKIGVYERDMASELTFQMFRHGSDPALPFSVDVTFGENTANPHAAPGERALKQGDLILFDWGASYQGYASDITRVFCVGNPGDEFRKIAGIVKEANTKARCQAAPGVPAGELDRCARKVIDHSGYGPYFTHRTGHGLGMEVHEPPYILSGNEFPLLPGNVFTIEPGIYLTGRGGIRIEDDMLIGESGAETLTSLPRELIDIG